jgi:hypothetical protein
MFVSGSWHFAEIDVLYLTLCVGGEYWDKDMPWFSHLPSLELKNNNFSIETSTTGCQSTWHGGSIPTGFHSAVNVLMVKLFEYFSFGK